MGKGREGCPSMCSPLTNAHLLSGLLGVSLTTCSLWSLLSDSIIDAPWFDCIYGAGAGSLLMLMELPRIFSRHFEICAEKYDEHGRCIDNGYSRLCLHTSITTVGLFLAIFISEVTVWVIVLYAAIGANGYFFAYAYCKTPEGEREARERGEAAASMAAREYIKQQVDKDPDDRFAGSLQSHGAQAHVVSAEV